MSEADKWSSDMGDMLATGRYSDLALLVNNVEYRVHKYVLASRSGYFRFQIQIKKSRTFMNVYFECIFLLY